MNELSTDVEGRRRNALRAQPDLKRLIDSVFGLDEDSVEAVLHRARTFMQGRKVVVWEADPLTFTFTFVSPEAQDLLGYPLDAWKQSGFWQSKVVHPADVSDAVSHCALATAAGVDHEFEYRACTAAGSVLRVHDVVHVIKGPLGFASCLRGIMFTVEAGTRGADRAGKETG